MSDVPSSPELFFTQFVPARFAALGGFEAVTSPGCVVFAVPTVGSWAFRLQSGQLHVASGLPADVVVRMTIPETSFQPIVVSGAQRVTALALPLERQLLAFRALTLDAERAQGIRSISGSVAFAVVDGSTTHRVYVTPGAAEPNLAQPECEVSCDAASFWGLQSGSNNPIELLMSGKLRIAGDAQIPMALSALFV